jgi:hypothetical protein
MHVAIYGHSASRKPIVAPDRAWAIGASHVAIYGHHASARVGLVYAVEPPPPNPPDVYQPGRETFVSLSLGAQVAALNLR